ncbi:hypothetical protein LEP1GSC126_2982 [Leptospira kirschneri str. 200801774]|uniref:hypothetical protein n=1 Tax=Leptospira kirschneri TaxID=29507 RepID=UPI0002BD5639|nr:hypothetical protein [Leptospira kirschneri]EMO79047.1 hypothetical protein LEP1GSC126_2982 [Leptospira kirschneri str. 200801774]
MEKNLELFSQTIKEFLADKDIKITHTYGFGSEPADHFDLKIRIFYKGETSPANHEDYIRFTDLIWDVYDAVRNNSKI